MTSIRMDVTGDLEKLLDRYGDGVVDQVSKAVTKTGLAVQATATKMIQQGPKTGRLYKKTKTRFHQASAPGEAPASDTGQLAREIDFNRLTPLSVEVGTTLRKGRWLEFGTMHMFERPWLRPSLAQNRKRFIQEIEKALKNGSK